MSNLKDISVDFALDEDNVIIIPGIKTNLKSFKVFLILIKTVCIVACIYLKYLITYNESLLLVTLFLTSIAVYLYSLQLSKVYREAKKLYDKRCEELESVSRQNG